MWTNAENNLRLMAWLVDVAIISTASLFVLFAFREISGLSFIEIQNILTTKELVSFPALIFLCFYSLYFTILDSSEISSFGKYFFNIKLVSTNSTNISLIQSFSRSFFVLLSVVLLGFLHWTGTIDNISDSKVVRNV